MAASDSWELIHDEPHQRVRRFKVPGGWLYQVEYIQDHDTRRDDGLIRTSGYTSGWHPPVFVTEKPVGGSGGAYQVTDARGVVVNKP